ncbi:deleted in malignant brain tumors 1 protein-like isoform X2 [Ctenopharyngodon idella]|uniref:deleted in malignant brain tumors 1 protein-like isoform X2 n=1 Tax=Ctenopharyngodon idella TaxID=7959 RepID=UPI002232231B|nr:deleted in malignant brain tumors 1 protein-like isoform X2 [Ctenopharyngodon idella]
MSIMRASALLSALLLLASTATASHFYGGSMTFSSRKNPNGSYEVYIRFKEAYHSCDSYDNWSCGSGNCGSKSYVSGQVDSSSNGGSWCQTEGVMKRTVPNNSPFQLQQSSCCWIYNTVTTVGNWRLLTHIDLGVRSDTSQPNRSPVATTLPIVRVPQNCPRNYNLLSCDPEHDQVRCRYGVFSANECGMCNQHAGFTLNQSTCTLSYGNSTTRGVYAFELVMEDYPKENITLNYTAMAAAVRTPFVNASSKPPLSKIPLQFALEVEAPAPSCTEGEYLPRFIHPTPHHGEHLQARVNQELEIRVKATATYSSITEVVFSGPLNSTKETTTTGEYVINWTPTSENFGQHFPICFAAEGQYGSRNYQSEMRCVIVVVEAEGPKANVTCSRDTMSVSIERATISGLHGNHLRLNNNASCLVSSNTTHVFKTFSLNECGTQIEETEEHLIFKNTIVTFDNPHDIITRKNEIEIEVMCKYQKKSSITTMFNAHRPAVNFTERGFGTFSYKFEFYQSGSFRNLRSPSTYPLEYNVGQPIYMEIEPVSVVQDTEVFLESCVATPYDNPNYPISYPIITNGCVTDETVNIYTSHEPSVKFSMEAFKFIGQYDQVFISCSIIICQANNPNTRCAQGCTNGTVIAPSSHVHKREAAIQTRSHFISQGPLRLKRSASLTEAISPSLNLNLVFVAGCVVAVVAMVCGVMVYKSRGSKINYKLVKSDEI